MEGSVALGGMERPAAPAATPGRHPVLGFLLRRTALGLATIVVASLLIFLATNALPGSVANAVLGRDATPARVAELNHELGLDAPVLERYASWLGGVLTGDLGESAIDVARGREDASVAEKIARPLGNSLELAAVVAVLLIPLSLLLGTLAAVKAGRALDYGISYVSLVLAGLPEFVLGIFVILVMSTNLGWFPGVSLIPTGSPLAHPRELVLPVLTLLGVLVGFCARQIRAGVIETLRSDYVTMARLSGVRETRVVWRYALRNALAPSVQTFALAVQYLLGGMIVVESLFTFPGIGQQLVQAVALRDIPVVTAIAFLLAALYVAINVLADLLVVLLVPKLRTGLR